jgi:cytochrome c oxidase cbb3-type subunit 2
MKNLPVLFCGIFLAVAASWCGMILAANLQYGGLQPAATEDGAPLYPQPIPGTAQQGRAVYMDLGCIYCHTQQVRPAGVGADIERGWGKRGSVPRDYIWQSPLLLGAMRTGPDLMDVGERYKGSALLYLKLYDAPAMTPGSVMPPYKFLFTTQKIADSGPAAHALKFPLGAPNAPEAGYEVVPTDRAVELIAYLHSLKLDYELPEAKFAPGTATTP